MESGRKAFGFLLGWFVCNFGLTMMNKAVFQWIGFHFPITVTFIHTAVSGIGACIVVRVWKIIPASHISWKGYQAIAGMSVLFCVNILVSNVGLDYVSVSFHQIVRALIPAMTVVIQFAWIQKLYSRTRLLALIPVCLGVAISCYTDVEYTAIGALVAFSGALLAAIKGCITNRILVGPLKLHTMDVLHYLGPLAAVQLSMIATYSGEFERVVEFWNSTENQQLLLSILLLNGVMAFILNVVSFLANSNTSPVTMTVCGNVKQAITIASSIFIFSTPVTLYNTLGILITLCGAASYSYVEYNEKYSAHITTTKSSV